MDANKLVWFPHPRHGYAIGRLVDIAREQVSVQPLAVGSPTDLSYSLLPASSGPESHPYECVYPAEPLDLKALERRVDAPAISADVDDNCALIHLNEAASLENVRLRFHRDKIYTYVAHILIAVNPYFEIKGLHSLEAIARYQGKSLGTLAPHVYAIADKAYRDMKALKQSQSIIINGESGAGKTESQKYVLRYLCLSGSKSSEGRLEKLILEANPLLEAFGNAKTIRNNNSSRFGKFIEIHYSSKFLVSGGLFYHYLLEKSRICTQSAGERNYHIFYQLCACLPDDQWRRLELGPPDRFQYLRSGCTQYFCSRPTDALLAAERKSAVHLANGAIQDQLIDELKCYQQTDAALANFGVDERHKERIYSVVAAVLHLGNISFRDDANDSKCGCLLDGPSAEAALASTARLVGLDKELLRQSLVSRIMSTARAGNKGTVYMVQLSAQQAQAARDALAKAIYSRLFDYIVSRIVNKSIPSTSDRSSYYIGVLDVAGFEYFQRNSFEQFLINFCNEKLQQFFNERILKEEQSIYDSEGLGLERVQFVDNQDCLQLLEAKASGIFDLLDEESRLPKPSASHFTQSCHRANQGHFRLGLPRTSKLRSHRELRDDEGFLVRHFAGAVCYETHSFIDKNNDALHASLRQLMLEAEHELLRELFAEPAGAASGARAPLASMAQQQQQQQQQQHLQLSGQPLQQPLQQTLGSASAGGGKLNFVSVGTTFRWQLNQLMGKLRSTGSHFIRCVKPNGEMLAHKFEGAQILSQLHCSGMDSVLQLMQQGFPSRASFADLYQTYRGCLPRALARLDAHLFCRALFKAVGLHEHDFRFGSSKVFFRPGKFAQFDQLVRSDAQQVAELVARVSRWLTRARWRKCQYCCLSAIKLANKILYRRRAVVGVQRNWRMALVRRRFRFRQEALREARAVAASLRDFQGIAGGQLEEGGALAEESALLGRELADFCAQLEQSLRRLAAGEPEPEAEAAAAAAEAGPARDSATADRLGAARAECARRLERLVTKRDLLVRSIRAKQARQAELAELERRVAAENQRRAELEEAARRDQLTKRHRAELEARRQAELSEQLAAAPTAAPPKPPDGRASAASASQERQSEQERRDYEIALRLSQEEGAPAPASPRESRLPTAPSGSATPDGGSARLDLTKWKYSELRDTINTSCDLDLLEACKREFHRRLKVYHAWRASNARQASKPGESARAPSSIMAAPAPAGEPAPTPTPSGGRHEQRYFRIPFVKAANGSGQRGWWFAHFDGQWIARQLELHPDKEPILLVAGQHDIEMCELSLRETRLTSKRGAEILPQEFEEEWQRHGGKAYAAAAAAAAAATASAGQPSSAGNRSGAAAGGGRLQAAARAN